MAASNFAPVPGNIICVEGGIIRKMLLPAAVRAFPPGSVMYHISGKTVIEPACMVVGEAASGDATNAAMIVLGVAGIAAVARVPQQGYAVGKFNAAGPAALNPSYAVDASKPYISVYTEGIFEGPCTAIATQRELGSYVQLDSFLNEGASGFYDAAGTNVLNTNYYLYNCMLKYAATQDAVKGFGRLVRRALVGDTTLRFAFKSVVLNIT